LGRLGFETDVELARASVSQEISLLKPKATNIRSVRSIRAALAWLAVFFFPKKKKKIKKHSFEKQNHKTLYLLAKLQINQPTP